jgi:hypothetical protein
MGGYSYYYCEEKYLGKDYLSQSVGPKRGRVGVELEKEKGRGWFKC